MRGENGVTQVRKKEKKEADLRQIIEEKKESRTQ